MQTPLTALPIGQKIKQVRVAKGLTQANVANDLNKGEMTIVRIEQGQTIPNAETLTKIKNILDIQHAPLLENELTVFKRQLWVWRALLQTNQTDKAIVMEEELSVIQDLPFEWDLSIMFQMIQSTRLLREGNITTVNEMIDNAKASYNEMSTDAKCLYHDACGDLESDKYYNNTTKSLEHYLKALEYKSPDTGEDICILLKIGRIYANMGKPFKAIEYLQPIQRSGELTNYLYAWIDGLLGGCYLLIGEYSKAKRLLENALRQARALVKSVYVAITLSDLALTNMMLGNIDEAQSLCEESMGMLKDTMPMYLISLSCMVRILLKKKQYKKAKEAIQEGKSLSKGQPELFAVVFESLGHLMNLNDDKSTKYLETVAIPFLQGTMQIFIAIEICNALEEHYKKKNSKIKMLTIAAVSRDIYREMIGDW
ncbi:MAG: helix-turn-helix transcriptional regulator [Defluviitaleaceae bacterium]|nr:helix-turn-helix transcriptional regulator [Defluviitaleaceae bacterium]